MKRKLLSLVAVVMAMSMTTSAFAATQRGSGDVDSDGELTANDVMAIVNSLTDSDEANVDGYTGIDGADARVLYKTILQPKTVSEDLELRLTTEGLVNGLSVTAFDAADLGSSTSEEANGLTSVSDTADATGITLWDAAYQLVNKAAAADIDGLNNQINKIYFNSDVKGEVYLTSENGWSMLCNALRYIIPMDAETAALCGKETHVTLTDATTDEDLARYEAFQAVKAYIVGEQDDPATANTVSLTTDDVATIMDLLHTAIPSGLDAQVITDTAKEVLAITDTKYAITVESEATGTETLSKDGVDSSAFIAGIIALKDYDTATLTDFRNTFGDKLTIGTPNVSVTFEVAETASAAE